MRKMLLLGAAFTLLVVWAPAAAGAEEGKGRGEGARGGFAGFGLQNMPAVQEEFKALDADGDGQLSVREYARSVSARSEFYACDKDRDGKVTKDEFTSFSFASIPGAQNRFSPESMLERLDADKNGEITEAEAGNAWQMLSRSDENQDGKVTKAELAKAREQREKEMAGRRAEEFGTLDKNGDGAISLLELLGRQAGRRGEAPKATETPKAEPGKAAEALKGRGAVGERLLRTMDRNGDGKIAKDEWTGPEERFTNMDANKDGIIDAAEIQARVRGMSGRGEEAKKPQ